MYLASVQPLVEQPWLWSCPYSTTALHQGKKLSQHQRSSVDNSHLPPELSGGPKHLTGKDITVLGLGWREHLLISSCLKHYQAPDCLTEVNTSTASRSCGRKDGCQSHSMDAREEAAMRNPMSMPRAEGTTDSTRLVGSDFF